MGLSDNGRFALFFSDATDLVAAGSNGFVQLYLRDLRKGTTSMVTVTPQGDPSGGNADSSSWLPPGAAVTNNGRFVVFSSVRTDLLASDTNGFEDAFFRDMKTGMTTRFSLRDAGSPFPSVPTGAASYGIGSSSNGKIAYFWSHAGAMASESDAGYQIYKRDFKAGTTTLVMRNVDGNGAAQYVYTSSRALSGNAKWMAANAGGIGATADDTYDGWDIVLASAR